jgi:formylglycine-generating enzyme required for sulfatase activity
MSNESIQNTIDALKERIIELEAQLDGNFNEPVFVKLPDRSYEVMNAPVTVLQYAQFCTMTNREMPEQPEPRHPNNPVVNVSWNDATAYAEWYSAETGTHCMLPYEDMYEHYCGDHQEPTHDIAVVEQEHITQVKTKKPNKYGLYDVLGLVREWMQDVY